MVTNVSYNAYASNVNSMTNSKKINFCANEEKMVEDIIKSLVRLAKRGYSITGAPVTDCIEELIPTLQRLGVPTSNLEILKTKANKEEYLKLISQ